MMTDPAREIRLRRAVEASPGTATLNGRPVGRGNASDGRQHRLGEKPGRGVAEVGTGREWVSVSEAARELKKARKTIARMADKGKRLRWA